MQRAEGVNATFKEPVYKILERIKNEPYFRWSGRMGGDGEKESKIILYLSPGKGSYHQAMPYAEGSLGVVNFWLAKKDRVLARDREFEMIEPCPLL